ncbi:ribonuclease H-like domain-containing protein [Tanacetum coccineum]
MLLLTIVLCGFGDSRNSVTFNSQPLRTRQEEICYGVARASTYINCNPTRTPVDTESKLKPEGTPISDLILYRSLAGGLQYLTFTRPDLSYIVQQICLYMHDLREPNLVVLQRILRYVQGTLEFGLQLYASSGYSLVAYSDADWVGATSKSTSGYCVFMGNNKRQPTLSRPSAEAEYRGVANVVVETDDCTIFFENYTHHY